MELHRLTPMKPYDKGLFNELYKKTERLRYSLVYQIDDSRFGVTKDEVMSWMDDKFIFVFNKYQDQHPPQVLLAHIINSLKTFKLKILRRSYQDNNSVNLNSVSIEDLKSFNVIEEDGDSNKELLLNLATSFMEKSLSREAWELLQIQLNPPIFISSKIPKESSKIPIPLILDFLGLDNSPKNYDYIQNLRDQISDAMAEARVYFKNYSLA